MGIVYDLRRVSDDDVRIVRAEPVQALYLAFGSKFTPPQPTPEPLGLLARLAGQQRPQAQPVAIPAPARSWPTDPPSPGAQLFDLDKAWEPITVLLTRGDFAGPWPADFLVDENRTVYGGDGDAVDFPILAFDSAETAEIADYLASLDRTDLAGRFDPEILADWGMEWLAEDADARNELLDLIGELTAWTRAVADDGSGMLGTLG